MKVLMLVFGVAVIAGAVAVGCGPKKAYCPQNQNGICAEGDAGVAPPAEDAGSGGGETIVISGND
jgi:hypothetical protein